MEKNNPTTIMIEHEGITVSVSCNHEDVDLWEIIDMFKGATFAAGFTDTQWDMVISALSEEIKEKNSISNN